MENYWLIDSGKDSSEVSLLCLASFSLQINPRPSHIDSLFGGDAGPLYQLLFIQDPVYK